MSAQNNVTVGAPQGSQTINSIASKVFGKDVSALLPRYAAGVGNELGDPLTPATGAVSTGDDATDGGDNAWELTSSERWTTVKSLFGQPILR